MFDRDFDYDYFGYKTLERSYLLRVDGKIVDNYVSVDFPHVMAQLGKDAFDAVRRLTDTSSTRFVHGQQLRLAPNYHLLSSFHPSRLNVNTGRLTPTMFDKVFQDVCELLNG